jgi:hypothetical protein
MWLWWMACTTQIQVATSMPEAEIGVLRSTSMPSGEPAAEHRGTGTLSATVRYSVFDTWWLWTRAPGGEVLVQRYPTELSVGPVVSCASGVLLLVPLLGCFYVTKPVSHEIMVQVEPAPAPVPPPSVILTPAPAPAGCAKDTDCKGERICVEGACVDP